MTLGVLLLGFFFHDGDDLRDVRVDVGAPGMVKIHWLLFREEGKNAADKEDEDRCGVGLGLWGVVAFDNRLVEPIRNPRLNWIAFNEKFPREVVSSLADGRKCDQKN